MIRAIRNICHTQTWVVFRMNLSTPKTFKIYVIFFKVSSTLFQTLFNILIYSKSTNIYFFDTYEIYFNVLFVSSRWVPNVTRKMFYFKSMLFWYGYLPNSPNTVNEYNCFWILSLTKYLLFFLFLFSCNSFWDSRIAPIIVYNPECNPSDDKCNWTPIVLYWKHWNLLKFCLFF